ncbi:MAG: PEP-CTERM sorting domain-containing protein [Kiritimatiellia bacterium]
MKKLLIALATVALAAGVQAASFNWNTSNRFTDSTGTVITTTDGYAAALNGGSIVLVLLGDGTYDGAKTVIAGQTAPIIKTTNPASTKGRLNATFEFVYDDTEGAVNVLNSGDILGVMFQDSEGNLSQLVYASDMTTTVDDTYTISGLTDDSWAGANFVFASGGDFTIAAVPEPTSGLLLLLGMAGLALRRKRA